MQEPTALNLAPVRLPLNEVDRHVHEATAILLSVLEHQHQVWDALDSKLVTLASLAVSLAALYLTLGDPELVVAVLALIPVCAVCALVGLQYSTKQFIMPPVPSDEELTLVRGPIAWLDGMRAIRVDNTAHLEAKARTVDRCLKLLGVEVVIVMAGLLFSLS